MADPEKLLADAERHFKSDDFAQAEATCQKILRNRPRHVEAVQMLAQSQCRQGNFAQAIETIDTKGKALPPDAILQRILAFARMNSGDLEGAIEAYRTAHEINPDDPLVANDYGAALRHQGNLKEAVRVLNIAVEKMPQLAFAQWNLGEIYSQLLMWPQAVNHLTAAVRTVPDNADVHNALAVALTQIGQVGAAITGYRHALKLRPDFVAAEKNLATLLRRLGQFEDAEKHARHVVTQQPENADALVSLGHILRQQGNIDAAIAENEKAIQLDETCIEAHNSLGSMLADAERFDEATVHLEATLALDADYPPAYQHLADLARQDRYEFSDERIAHVDQLLGQEDLPLPNQRLLGFSLAGLFDHRGDADRAFPLYQQANAAQQTQLEIAGAAFDVERHEASIDETIRRCDADFFAQTADTESTANRESELPIFVVGMPRSGLTLVEQIIATHPDAASAGEPYAITQFAHEMHHLANSKQADMPSESEIAGQMAGRYLDILRDFGPGARRVVDKMWGNFVYLGFIATMFPKARVVHCRRDPMDVCLSCYQCNFETNGWAWRLEDIAAYHCQYERLMAHWREVLPLAMHEVVYEELVADQERVSRDLIEFCGLDWNDACLEFYTTEGPDRAANRVQIRQPIYTSAVGRAQRYEKDLAALREGLDG